MALNKNTHIKIRDIYWDVYQMSAAWAGKPQECTRNAGLCSVYQAAGSAHSVAHKGIASFPSFSGTDSPHLLLPENDTETPHRRAHWRWSAHRRTHADALPEGNQAEVTAAARTLWENCTSSSTRQLERCVKVSVFSCTSSSVHVHSPGYSPEHWR